MTIHAPFTAEQVQLLNERQCHVDTLASIYHPFTCPHRGDTRHAPVNSETDVLIATESGWVCAYCGYTQDYAFPGMLTPSEPDGFDDFFAPAGLDQDAMLLQRIDQCIQSFETLYSSRIQSVDQGEAENASSQRIWDTVTIMLGCLKQRRMAQLGIETRPGQDMGVSSDWIPTKHQLPQIDQAVHTLVFRERIGNPLHPGFGTNYWIRLDSIGRDGKFLGDLIHGGKTTHWQAYTQD